MIDAVDFVVRSSLVLVAGFSVSWLLRRRSAALRHSVLAAALTLAVAQPMVAALLPVIEIPVTVWDANAVVPVAVETNPGAVETEIVLVERPQPVDWSAWTFRIWLAGVAISLGLLAAGAFWLTWLGARAVDAGPNWQAPADELRTSLGIRTHVRIAITPHPALLVTWGAIAPVILLPSDAGAWPIDRIRLVLAHEMAHLQRRDWLVQLLAEVSRAINWFNPLFWRACAILRRESEQATDDMVLDLGFRGTSYASHLLDLAKAFSVHGRTWLPAPSIARPSTLERRVRAMLNPQIDRRPGSRLRRATLAILLLVIAWPIAAASRQAGAPSGTVLDPMSRPLANASLRLSPANGGQVIETRSDARGAFQFPQVAAGDYFLSVDYPGFSSKRHRMTLSGDAVTISLQVQVGTLNETVTVGKGTNEREVYERPAPPSYGPSTCNAAVGGQVSQPMKIRDVRPRYRQDLIDAGVEGSILLHVIIAKDGRVRSVDVLTQGHPDLGDEAIAAVSQWQFTPTYLNCEPVEVQMYVNVMFKADR